MRIKKLNRLTGVFVGVGLSIWAAGLMVAGEMAPELAMAESAGGLNLVANVNHEGTYVRLSSTGMTAGKIGLTLEATNEGVIAGAVDQVTVTTNAMNGYKLYALTAGDDNNLYLNGEKTTATNKMIKAVDGTLESPRVLENNTWGFALKKATTGLEANNFDADYGAPVGGGSQVNFTPTNLSKWAGMAAKSGMDLPPFFKGVRNSQYNGDKIDIYYAAKVNTSLLPGEYKGVIVYTAVADAIVETMVGHVEPNVIGNVSGATPITITVPVYTNYILKDDEVNVKVDGRPCAGVKVLSNDITELKVSCKAPAKPGGGSAEVLISIPSFAKAIAITGGVNYDNRDITTIATMQEMTPERCAATEVHKVATLRDARDNKKYKVAKLLDENCWMVQNLGLELTAGQVLDDTKTDLPAGQMFNPQNTTQRSSDTFWNRDCTLLEDNRCRYEKNNARSYRRDGLMQVYYNPPAAISSEYGVFYNWYAATAGTTSSADVTDGYRAPGSICPKGWMLPMHGGVNIDKSYAKLAKAYFEGSSAYQITDDGNIRRSGGSEIDSDRYIGAEPAGFLRFGIVDNYSVSHRDAGKTGYYWSGANNSYMYAKAMKIEERRLEANSGHYRVYGANVRCVAR